MAKWKWKFGVGCFHFGLPDGVKTYDATQYIEDLESTLNALPTVEDLRIEFPHDAEDYEWEDAEEPSRLSDGEQPFPHPDHLTISFTISIPERFREDGPVPVHLSTDKYRIWIHYNYSLPVTFVELVEGSDEDDPSRAVIAVREFLSAEIAQRRLPLRFEFLGPSPFHADFMVVIDDEATHPISTILHKTAAYDVVELRCQPNAFQQDDLREGIYTRLAHELDVFYFISAIEVRRMRQWSAISDTIENLLALTLAKGAIAAIFRFLKQPRLLQQLVTEVVRFEADEVSTTNVLREYLHHLRRQSDRLLPDQIDDENDARAVYPITETYRLIEFLEGRSVKRVEWAIVILAAVLGGIVGGLVTKAMERKVNAGDSRVVQPVDHDQIPPLDNVGEDSEHIDPTVRE